MEFEQDFKEFDKLINKSMESAVLKKKIQSDYKSDLLEHEDETANPNTVQKTIDLHGYNKKEAIYYLEQFLIESYRSKYRKLRVITGKGNNSENKEPVIKPETERILNNDRFNIIRKFYPEKLISGNYGSFIVFLKNSG